MLLFSGDFIQSKNSIFSQDLWSAQNHLHESSFAWVKATIYIYFGKIDASSLRTFFVQILLLFPAIRLAFSYLVFISLFSRQIGATHMNYVYFHWFLAYIYIYIGITDVIENSSIRFSRPLDVSAQTQTHIDIATYIHALFFLSTVLSLVSCLSSVYSMTIGKCLVFKDRRLDSFEIFRNFCVFITTGCYNLQAHRLKFPHINAHTLDFRSLS